MPRGLRLIASGGKAYLGQPVIAHESLHGRIVRDPDGDDAVCAQPGWG
jgi:hypothetical protein